MSSASIVTIRGVMNLLMKLVLFLIIITVGGCGVFLAIWDIPAPSRIVEKVLDDSRFPR